MSLLGYAMFIAILSIPGLFSGRIWIAMSVAGICFGVFGIITVLAVMCTNRLDLILDVKKLSFGNLRGRKSFSWNDISEVGVLKYSSGKRVYLWVTDENGKANIVNIGEFYEEDAEEIATKLEEFRALYSLSNN